MSELTCLHCQTKLPENAIFCHICGQPAVCQGCHAPIQPAARFCNQCGKPLPETTSIHLPSSAIGILPGYNRVKIDEVGSDYQYHSDMILTNEAIGEFREVIPRVVRARTPISHQEASNNHQQDQGTVVEMPPSEIPSVPQLPAGSSQAATSITNEASEEAIWKIFRRLDDGKLRQISIKLKASSKKDYTLRLIYLFLYAKEILGADKVPRTDVYEILDDVSVKDTNTATYISQDQGLRFEENCLRLTTEARIRTQQYIADAFKAELEDVWYPGMETSANKHQKSSSKRKKAGDKGAKVDQWVEHEETKALAATVAAQQSAVAKWSVLDKAKLGLYGIYKIDKEQEVIASLIATYLNKAFSIHAKEDSIRPALLKAVEKGDSNIIPSPDGQGYRITQSGCDYIQAKLNGGMKP